MKKLLLTTSLVGLICTGTSQNSSTVSEIYSSFDETLGAYNTNLSYGDVFEEQYRKITKNNHNFFFKDEFLKGSVSYRGDIFFNIELKYDVVNDLLVARINNQNESIAIVLEKQQVDTFKINNSNFINTFDEKYGFLEELVKAENFSILKKHKKLARSKKDLHFVHHVFKKKKDRFFIKYGNNYHEVKSKKDFIAVFPNQKEIISKHFKTEKELRKNDFTAFVHKLMNHI
ncbi:hypothetical protein [Tenacibaculum xiamenense]|uniref:hypothetical protein n=1 Tax=Tenacibaculum xiamenense TaxID=1261553 RepID=UPI00389323E9